MGLEDRNVTPEQPSAGKPSTGPTDERKNGNEKEDPDRGKNINREEELEPIRGEDHNPQHGSARMEHEELKV